MLNYNDNCDSGAIFDVLLNEEDVIYVSIPAILKQKVTQKWVDTLVVEFRMLICACCRTINFSVVIDGRLVLVATKILQICFSLLAFKCCNLIWKP